MKIKMVTALMVATAIVIFGSVNGAFALPVDVWQIGKMDGTQSKAYLGALEYSPDGAFEPVFDYTVDALDPIDNGTVVTFPGYMGPVNVSHPLIGAPADGRPATHTANSFNIMFNLDADYLAVDLVYGVYGSESDVFWLQYEAEPFSYVGLTDSGSEGGFQQFTFDLGDLVAGNYTLTGSYWGGGAINGHYIDFMKMTGTPVAAHSPEPATMVLFGVGLVGLVGLGRTKLFRKR
jgi:hypothetical protein